MSGVSVIIPTYNRTRFLEDALQSILNQTEPVDEIILVNDGSESSYMPELERLTGLDSRIKRIDNERNQGVSYSRNQGIEVAQSEYICFVDDDDTLDPEFVEKMVTILDHDIHLGGALCETELHPKSIESAYSERVDRLLKNRQKVYGNIELNSSRYFLIFCPMVHSFLFRKRCFETVQFSTDLTYGEDLYCWLSMVHERVTFKKLDWIGGHVRIHEKTPTYQYDVKKKFHVMLSKADILDNEGALWQAIRFFLFEVVNGKSPGPNLWIKVLGAPYQLIKFAIFNWTVRFG